MLSWFRKKRKAIGPLIAAVFLGGLFSFLCPHCLAKTAMEMNTRVFKGDNNEHCSHMGDGKTQPVKSHKHCNGSCGCGDRAMLIGTRHLATLNDNKGFPDIRMPVLNELSWNEMPAAYISFTIGRPYKPDRACFSPLDRNCVLLN